MSLLFLKAPLSIVCNDDGIMIEVSSLCVKVSVPIVVRLFESLTSTKSLSRNALCPMNVMESGKYIKFPIESCRNLENDF